MQVIQAAARSRPVNLRVTLRAATARLGGAAHLGEVLGKIVVRTMDDPRATHAARFKVVNALVRLVLLAHEPEL